MGAVGGGTDICFSLGYFEKRTVVVFPFFSLGISAHKNDIHFIFLHVKEQTILEILIVTFPLEVRSLRCIQYGL